MFEVTARVLCTKAYTEFCVVCRFVLDKTYCNRLVRIGSIGGLESVLEVTILVGRFVCIILKLNVVGLVV